VSRGELRAALDALALMLYDSETDPEYGSLMRTATWSDARFEALWRSLSDTGYG
jgi:hypothetical protein